jgi:hypothetical protein
MVREGEGAASMARRCERRRGQCSAGMAKEEEMPGGPRGLKGRIGRWVAGPTGLKFEGKLFLE